MEKDLQTAILEIRQALTQLQSDIDAIKKAVVKEVEFSKEEMEIEKEMKELKTDPQLTNEVRYEEESLDEVEKELGG